MSAQRPPLQVSSTRAPASRAWPRLRSHLLSAAKHGFLILVTFICLVPFLLVVMTSLKTKVDAIALPPKWLFVPTLANYAEQLGNEAFFNAVRNSLIIAFSATAIATVIGVLAGYALSRFRFRFRSAFGNSFLLLRAVPPIALVIPYYMIWRNLHLTNTYVAIIVMYLALALPLLVWMMRSFFVEVPVEIEEAALVDGCTRLQALRLVLLPIVVPGIVAAAGLAFIMIWNEFLFALTNTGIDTRTLPIEIYNSLGYYETNWAKLSSAAVVAVVPAIIFVALTQRYIVRGLSMGAVKG
jgi:multiple sugar transport system permease protein